MATKLIPASFMALALASTGCHGGGTTRHDYTPIQYLKNYALSACIADGYQSADVIRDATAAANGYMELGSLDIDAYNEALLLGREFLAKEYLSKRGEKLILMKCLDLFHSRELDQLARKYGGAE